MSDLQPRPRPTWAIVALLAALIAVAAAVFVALRDRGDGDRRTAIPNDCPSGMTQLLGPKDVPAARLSLRHGDRELKLFTGPTWVATCETGPQGLSQTFASEIGGDEGKAGLRLLGGLDAVLKPGVAMGRLPEGVTQVKLVLADGRELAGAHDRQYFLFWPEDKADLQAAEVVAADAEGQVLGRAEVLTDQSEFSPAVFDKQCAKHLRGMSDQTANQVAEGDFGGMRVRFYRGARSIAMCTWQENGTTFSMGTPAAGSDDVSGIRLMLDYEDGSGGVICGAAPEGAERVDVTMADGTVAHGEVHAGGYGAVFVASWEGRADPGKIAFHAAAAS